MRSYEIAFLFKEGDDVEGVKERIKGYISKIGSEFVSDSDMGLRELAYPIHRNREKFNRAFYYFVKARLNPELIPEMERSFKFDESIIRYLILAE
ncbi:MAG: 30S ribosomal protein S6 [Brevinematia bacterium]